LSDTDPRQRLDKWLWFARFFKTRSLAAKQVSGGAVRLNGTRVTKAATQVAPGDVLTFAQGNAIRLIRVEALGTRRGPAPEARQLYTDMDPPQAGRPPSPARVGPRPTKKDRRVLDKTRPPTLE